MSVCVCVCIFESACVYVSVFACVRACLSASVDAFVRLCDVLNRKFMIKILAYKSIVEFFSSI